MNFILVNPQHIVVSNPIHEETIMPQQEYANMITFFTEKTCNTWLAFMQHKDDISSCILYWYGLIGLASLQTSTENIAVH